MKLLRTRNKNIITMCAFVGLVAMVGCAPVIPVTPNSLRAAKGTGTGAVRVYATPPTTVWSTVLTVLSDLKLRCIEENREAGSFLAESGLPAYGTGELIVVFVEPQNHTRDTRVEVISKPPDASSFIAFRLMSL